MQPTDITLISDLAQAVRDASPVAKDPDAERLISQLIGTQPDALYFLVQTVLLQKEALQAQSVPGAGPGQAAFPAATPPAAPPTQPRGPFGRLQGSGPVSAPTAGGGSSFLKTAAAGAAGAAGGLLVAQGISSLFRGGPGSEGGGFAGSYEDPEEGWDDDADWE